MSTRRPHSRRVVRRLGQLLAVGVSCVAVAASGCAAPQGGTTQVAAEASSDGGVMAAFNFFKKKPAPANAEQPAEENTSVWTKLNVFKTPTPPPPPAESLVLRGDRLEAPQTPPESKAAAELAGARELYRQGDYDTAETLFHKIAENQKNPPAVAEEARFYEAECLRRQQRYPKAADTYTRLLSDFPSGQYREQSVQHLFDIANYWLDDTRADMDRQRKKRDGEDKTWISMPTVVHFDKSKPFMDEQGRALEKLEQVRYNDMTGPLADKALFLAGSVKFYNEDYPEADHYFSQLVEMHPKSEFATQAIELALISKQLSTGGSSYDGRKVAEARKLVDAAVRSYPELASQKSDFLNRQLIGISLQQAEKDYKIAEFYRRTGHHGSAYFYYEIVRRRYPGTKYFDMATERILELKTKAEKKGEAAPAPSEPRDIILRDPVAVPHLNPAPSFPQLETAPRPRPYNGPQ